MRTLKLSSLLILSLALLAGCQLFSAAFQADPMESPEAETDLFLPFTQSGEGDNLGDELPSGYTVAGSQVYTVNLRLSVFNEGPGQPDKQNLWVALIGDQPPYQTVNSATISPAGYQTITDEYGNRYAEFDLADLAPGERVDLEFDYLIIVNEVTFDLGSCQGDLPNIYTQAELHIEADNPQIQELSAQLAAGKGDSCETERAFYTYVADNLVYSFNGANWGAQAALGEMGADCTEYASLQAALSRAAGIPARYVEGLYVLGEKDEASARTEHAWLEAYLPGTGWTPMDPTLGRVPLDRQVYFAGYPSNHIIVTRGRSPSTLRGDSYWTHLYWPGDSTQISVVDHGWQIIPSGQ